MVVPVLRLGIHPEMERPAILNRSMPSIAGATISISPVKAAKGACQREVSSLDARTSFTRFRSSIPDVERFSQEFLYQCSHWRASAYVGGPNLLTWEEIYHQETGGNRRGAHAERGEHT